MGLGKVHHPAEEGSSKTQRVSNASIINKN